MKACLVLATGALLGSGAFTGAAAACDPDLDPVPSVNGYKPRSDTFCEGLFVSRVGAPAIVLLSLTTGLCLAGSPPAALRLAVPAAAPAVAHVRAVGIPPGLYYRMDTDIAPGAVADWRSAGVLGTIGVGLDDVGVFAFVAGRTGAPVFYPVVIGQARAATVVAQLRPSTAIDNPSWRFVPAGAAAPPEGGWARVALSNNRLTVALPPGRGTLQVSWADAVSGMSRHASFAIGGG